MVFMKIVQGVCRFSRAINILVAVVGLGQESVREYLSAMDIYARFVLRKTF
jgi:hypothetical protein